MGRLTTISIFVGAIITVGVMIHRLPLSEVQATYNSINQTWEEPNSALYHVLVPARIVTIDTTEISVDSGAELSRKPLLEYHYDQAGRLIERIGYRNDGVPLPPTTYSYDNQNRLIKETHYNISNIPWGETYYTYDSLGRPMEAVQKDLSDYSVLNKKTYTYDPEENSVELDEYDWNNSLRRKVKYIKDTQGRVKEAYSIIGNSEGKTYIKYNDNGEIIESKSYDPNNRDEVIVNILYEYDSKGNWIRRAISKKIINGEVVPQTSKEVIYRNITYADK